MKVGFKGVKIIMSCFRDGCKSCDVPVRGQIRIANSVDQNEMAHYEPSHLDLHCLLRFLFWSAGLESLTMC